MLASILVGIDGSSDSDSALRLALEWAGAVDASLVGLGIVDEPGLHGSEEYLVGELYFRKLHTEILDELRAKVGEALKHASDRAAEAGVRFQALEQTGVPYAEIVRQAQACDVVVLGQHTRFRFGWEDAGDATLAQVLANSSRRSSPCPRPSARAMRS